MGRENSADPHPMFLSHGRTNPHHGPTDSVDGSGVLTAARCAIVNASQLLENFLFPCLQPKKTHHVGQKL